MGMKISRIINLCIGIDVLWVWLSMTFILGPLGAQSEGGFQNLKYFTVLSNLLQGDVSLAYFFGKRVGRWKYASTTAMALTVCVVLFFLECVTKMPEAQLAGNSVAVTASLLAFLR